MFRYHLYAGEASEGISAPSEPDVSTFTLDDGRRIGMLICFDLMFANPMDRLATAEAVEAVVFPHYWYDELPFLTAPQAHFGHAVSNNLTILASGHNNLVTGSLGSGIYSGKSQTIEGLVYNRHEHNDFGWYATLAYSAWPKYGQLSQKDFLSHSKTRTCQDTLKIYIWPQGPYQ